MRCPRLGGYVVVLALALPARAEVQLGAGVRGLLAELGEDWGGGLDLALALAWEPRREFAVGCELSALVPLHTGADARAAEVVLRAVPAVWLFFGRDDAWGFVKLGVGLAGHVVPGDFLPVLALSAGAGFAVAPRELPFHFGFEIVGDLGVAGAATHRTVGLGGFLGWRL